MIETQAKSDWQRIAARMEAAKQNVDGGNLGQGRNRWNRSRCIALSLLVFMAGLLNWYAAWSGWPYLRFGKSVLRGFAGLAILGIPWFIFFLIITWIPLRRVWARIILLTILVPVLLATIPIALLESFSRISDEPLKSVETDGYRVRLYQLNCGVLCDFAVSVDQERVLAPFTTLSQRLYVFDEAIDATVETLGENELGVTTLPYTKENPNIRVQVFHLKPHFFF